MKRLIQLVVITLFFPFFLTGCDTFGLFPNHQAEVTTLPTTDMKPVPLTNSPQAETEAATEAPPAPGSQITTTPAPTSNVIAVGKPIATPKKDATLKVKKSAPLNSSVPNNE